jgi:hypothetical protein
VFRAKTIAKMPDVVVQDVVAHELAHVYQKANGIRPAGQHRGGAVDYVDRHGDYWGGKPEIEEDADWTAGLWGFDSDSIHRWYCDTRGIIERPLSEITPEELMKCFRRIERYGR